MTIKIIEAPDHGRSWWHVDTNVREVLENRLIYDDGSEAHKNRRAKVEILSEMDAPEEWDERKAFFAELNGLTEPDQMRSPFDGYNRLSAEAFKALDLPTHY